jgi:hypothetical protein
MSPKEDVAQIAFRVMSATIEQAEKGSGPEPPPKREKNPAAVALGLLGGSKGGKMRAAKLSARRRKQIASRAAKMRWKKSAHS